MFSNVFRRKFNHGMSLQALLQPVERPTPPTDRRPPEPGGVRRLSERPEAAVIRVDLRRTSGSA